MSKAYSVWELIDRIGGVQPLHKEQIESLLSAKVATTSGNQYYTFWDGTAELPLENNLKISKINFSTANPPKPANVSLSVYLGGACISKQDVHAHFPKMEIIGAPRGRSLDEETVYSVNTQWGEVRFGFAERNPDCLVRLGFEFNEVKPQN